MITDPQIDPRDPQIVIVLIRPADPPRSAFCRVLLKICYFLYRFGLISRSCHFCIAERRKLAQVQDECRSVLLRGFRIDADEDIETFSTSLPMSTVCVFQLQSHLACPHPVNSMNSVCVIIVRCVSITVWLFRSFDKNLTSALVA